MTYNPVTGENYSKEAARSAWGSTMSRNSPAWSIRGDFPKGDWYWGYFNFKNYCGKVTVETDGFHWATVDYATDETLISGVTTSVYEAFQSVVQNKIVTGDFRKESK
jgi:hypothetical protein